MLRHKNIDRVCSVILALTLLASALFVGAAATGAISADGAIGYENRLFDQSRVHTIDIVMDDWESFLSTASSEQYASCSIVIDGESYKNVAIRSKGNTSLSSVAAYGNNRYSFKVEFDHYQSGSTYHGLDKLSLNNLIQDNTYMKDYFAYTMMARMGVASPLCSFVQISVNGDPWGLYLAVEGVEDAFLQRNYGKDYGELYKPDSISFGGGRGNGGGFDMNDFMKDFDFSSGDGQAFSMPDMGNMPGGFDFSQFAGSESGAASMPDMGNMPGGFDFSQFAGSEDEAASMPDMGSMPGGFDFSQFTGSESGAASMPDMGNMPGGFDFSQFAGSEDEAASMPDMGNMPNGFDFSQFAGSEGEAASRPDMGSMPGGFDFSQFAGSEGEAASRPDMGSMPGSFGGFGGMGGSDVKLQYIDDDPASYANIFDSAKTEITKADQERLIASIKALSEGDTSVVDTDAVIRYMAVHNFLCNDDSYTGMMVHNYYLYEENGVMAMIPWDYNLAYGGFTGGNATSTVNTDIDSLVSMGNASDRPMAAWITESEEARAEYYAVYQEFISSTFDSGWFASEIDRVTAMIDPYVKNDPTAFCTYEEFRNAAEILKSFCLKRAQSVSGQLSGDNTRVDASELDLSAMGTMSGMGGFGGPGGGFGMPGSKSGEESARSKPSSFPEGGDEPSSSASPSTDAPRMDRSFAPYGMKRTPDAKSWLALAACTALLLIALAAVKRYQQHR